MNKIIKMKERQWYKPENTTSSVGEASIILLTAMWGLAEALTTEAVETCNSTSEVLIDFTEKCGKTGSIAFSYVRKIKFKSIIGWTMYNLPALVEWGKFIFNQIYFK